MERMSKVYALANQKGSVTEKAKSLSYQKRYPPHDDRLAYEVGQQAIRRDSGLPLSAVGGG